MGLALLDVDPDHWTAFLDGEFDQSGGIILGPRICPDAEAAPMNKDEYRDRMLNILGSDDVQIETLCSRELGLFTR